MERLTVDVAIIGGGTAACAAAVALREAGLTVALLEKRLCGAGRQRGEFRRRAPAGPDFSELPLSRARGVLWDGLNAKLGEDVGFEATGHIKLARSESDMAVLETYARDAAEYGLDLQLLGANALRAEMPWLGPAVVGASLSPTDGQANPRVVGPPSRGSPAASGRSARAMPGAHAAHDGAGFHGRGRGGERESRHLVNAAGAYGGVVAGWFGEAAPWPRSAPTWW